MSKREETRISREEVQAQEPERGEDRTFVRLKPGQKKNRLKLPEVPGFRTRIVNEDNVPYLLDRGYEFLDASYVVGDKTVSAGRKTGSAMTVDVGNTTAYVMILSEEYALEDDEVKRQRVMAQSREPLDKLDSDDFYGKVSLN